MWPTATCALEAPLNCTAPQPPPYSRQAARGPRGAPWVSAERWRPAAGASSRSSSSSSSSSGAGVAPQRRRSSGATFAASSSSPPSTLEGEAWEAAHGQATLRHGLSLEQGLRETMEDAAQVVPNGPCGFLFASEAPAAAHLPPAACCTLLHAVAIPAGSNHLLWHTPHPSHPPTASPPSAAAVFDGHGGFAAADYLQQHLYRVFTRVLSEQGPQADLESSQNLAGLACPLTFTQVLTDSFKHADEDLLAWMHGEQRWKHSGTRQHQQWQCQRL